MFLTNRRDLLLFMSAIAAASCSARTATEENVSGAPEKIHLIPDDYRIQHAGQLGDGRLFFADLQLYARGGVTKDYVCTFIFDTDGVLVEHNIEVLGARGAYPEEQAEAALGRHLATLGETIPAAIWVRPFSVTFEGIEFGLVARRAEDGEWRVEFMPGNTLSFYPPWEAGEYDT
jgi:hypothetical protein